MLGGGLAGAFGSGGGSTSAFGTKTGDVFTTVTVVAFVLFMLLSIWLSFQIKWKSTNVAVIPNKAAQKSDTGTGAATPDKSPLGGAVLPESDKPATATSPTATQALPASPMSTTTTGPATVPSAAPASAPQ